jgi:hypothetical protein
MSVRMRSPQGERLPMERHTSIHKTSVTSKHRLLTQLQDDKKVNIAELLKKKLRKDIGYFDKNIEKYANIIITREVNRFLNTKDIPFSVDGLKDVKRRIMKIIKKCKNKLEHKKKLSDHDFSNTQNSAQKSTFNEINDNPYDANFGKVSRMNVVSTQNILNNRNMHNRSVTVESVKRSGFGQFPSVTSRDTVKKPMYRNGNILLVYLCLIHLI